MSIGQSAGFLALVRRERCKMRRRGQRPGGLALGKVSPASPPWRGQRPAQISRWNTARRWASALPRTPAASDDDPVPVATASPPLAPHRAAQPRQHRTPQPRARDEGGLAAALEAALRALGQELLAEPGNEALRAALRAGSLSADEYLAELLTLTYGVVFLCCAEARGCLHPPAAAQAARQRYQRLLSLSRLRAPAPRRARGPVAEGEHWAGLRTLFHGLAHGDPRLALPRLGGIFAQAPGPWLRRCRLTDAALVRWLSTLGWLGSGPAATLAWQELSPEQLGGAYERLLGLQPELSFEGQSVHWQARAAEPGGSRRRTGSYYTPERLVQALLDAALEPLLERTLAAHPDEPARALASLAIVDPACGPGHFLLAAARRLALRLTRCVPQGHAWSSYPMALRQVLQHCIYGVDLNPMAVELCRLGLWLELADPSVSAGDFEQRIRVGNSLLGSTAARCAAGVPDAAWEPLPDEDRRAARALQRRNRAASGASAADGDSPPLSRELCDCWCAAFLWPRDAAALEAAPTNELFRPAQQGTRELPADTRRLAAELAARHHFCHWELEFPGVFARGGFDLVLGNPPWIAHAGRASQRLPPELKRFFAGNYAAFADYPTTHGMFVSLAARLLREGGYLGLIIPSSLSELAGYQPTRLAHDQLCEFPAELIDFGEGQFAGVTQPCMALVSRRSAAGRRDAPPGQPWPVQREDLDPVARALIARLSQLPCLPPELFGERGVQSDRELLQHFSLQRGPEGRCSTPIREGTDVREHELLPPRWYVDRAALGARMRSAEEFARVGALVRQTARYPIAVLSDGLAFRNSLLAVFGSEQWPAAALVSLLNSALVRWLHFMRFRDARQPILPQLKIAHLRAIPAPPARSSAARLARLALKAAAQGGAPPRRRLDALVFDLYDLSPGERELVTRWHDEQAPGRSRRAAPQPSASVAVR